MRVAMLDCDRTNFPNLALMKLSAAYKGSGHEVVWYSAGAKADKVCASKVFTFTPAPDDLPSDVVWGGTGSPNPSASLPDWIEHLCPDYSLYGLDYSVGFLTRGCVRTCSHCFVPEKEGHLRANADIEEFLRHDKAVLMDNNVLASAHGVAQIEKIVRLGVKVDFNQGLDARLIDHDMARLLSKVKWLAPLRLACDSQAQLEPIRKAVEHLRWHNCTPSRFFCYALIQDVEEAAERVKALKGMYLDPFCQPYRDREGTEPTRLQRRFARYVNTPAEFKRKTWEEYQLERGDRI